MKDLLLIALICTSLAACNQTEQQPLSSENDMDQHSADTELATNEKPAKRNKLPLPIYLYQGYQEAIGEKATDGIFQDFSTDSGNLGYIWSDSDATLHNSTDNGWIKGHIVRNENEPFLRVSFNRQGYGGSITLVPLEKTPEAIPQTGAYLRIPLRTSTSACLGLRIKEADNEIWAYGPKPNEYHRLCLKPSLSWQYFDVPLSSDAPEWYKFPYSGNLNFGSDKLEADVLVQVTFEIGPGDDYYFGLGEGNVDIGAITLSAKPS